MFKMASRSGAFAGMDKCLERRRIVWSLWNLLLLPYIPMGFLVLLIRVCIVIQALLVLLLVPNGWLKRMMLRVMCAVLGLVVVTRDFHRKQGSVRMMVCNRVSHLDHIPLHLALDCITTSTGQKWPLLGSLFDHHMFTAEQEELVVGEAKMLPEFDDTVSIPDSAVTPFVAHPECCPTNTKGLLKFSSWCFAVDTTVQPIAVSYWHLFDVNLSTIYSNGLWDLFWMLYMPFTLIQLRMLPIAEMSDSDTPQQFADRVQHQVAASLNADCCQASKKDFNKWVKDPTPIIKFKPTSSTPAGVTAYGPVIPEADFPQIPDNLQDMVDQVTTVMPQVPFTVIRRELIRTKSVDTTVANLLDGKVDYEPIPTLHDSLHPAPNTSSSSSPSSDSGKISRPKKVSIKDCHKTFKERKEALLDQAKRAYIEKHRVHN